MRNMSICIGRLECIKKLLANFNLKFRTKIKMQNKNPLQIQHIQILMEEEWCEIQNQTTLISTKSKCSFSIIISIGNRHAKRKKKIINKILSSQAQKFSNTHVFPVFLFSSLFYFRSPASQMQIAKS